MDDDLFLTSYNSISKRHAILSEEGHVAFLYLHQPSEYPEKTGEVDAVVIAYNGQDLIEVKDVQSYRPEPPPIAKGYGTTEAVIIDPKRHRWEFAWDDDGQSVLLLKDDEPWSLVNGTDRKGYSKAVRVDGPWGHPWDDNLVNSIG